MNRTVTVAAPNLRAGDRIVLGWGAPSKVVDAHEVTWAEWRVVTEDAYGRWHTTIAKIEQTWQVRVRDLAEFHPDAHTRMLITERDRALALAAAYQDELAEARSRPPRCECEAGE